MTVDLVVGAPVWDRAWCLPIWFDSLDANVDPENTGLIFVVPPSDMLSREIINARTRDYAFVDVIRDKHEQHDREVRRRDNHSSLAHARNTLLRAVNGVRPKWYLSWDSDLLIAPGTLEDVRAHNKPVTTVWTWLNRREPQKGQHWDEETQSFIPVEWNEPVNATAMKWDEKHAGVAYHLDPCDWDQHARGIWPCDVVLAWQLMKAPVYQTVQYGPHPHGEDLPFNASLRRQEIQPWCYGLYPGVHLFDRTTAEEEVREGYPRIMKHAHDKPLAATRPEPESESLRLIGFYEQQTSGHLATAQ